MKEKVSRRERGGTIPLGKKSSPMGQKIAIDVPLSATEKLGDIVILKMLRFRIG